MDKSVVCLLLFFEMTSPITADIYYCDGTGVQSISGAENGTIRTVYEGSGLYIPDMRCEWVIDAGEGSLIALDVTGSHLTWAPPGAICPGYDYIEIQNGQGPDENEETRPGEDVEDSAVIVAWCGERNPHHIHSSGRYLYILFRSDDRPVGNFAGVTLQFTVFRTSLTRGGCPPGWTDQTLEPSGGDKCFTVSSQQRDWIGALAHCNYMQANLAGLDSDLQVNFVTDLISENAAIKSYDNVWLGLNDIGETGQYRWPNGSLNQWLFRWREKPHIPDDYSHCVCLQYGDGLWKEEFCNEINIQTTVKYYYVCEKSKVGATELYGLPQKNTPNKKSSGISVPVKAVLISGGVVILLVIAAATAYYYHRKKSDDESNASSSITYGQSISVIQPRRQRSEDLPMARQGADQRSDHYTDGRSDHRSDRFSDRRSDHPPSYEEALSLK